MNMYGVKQYKIKQKYQALTFNVTALKTLTKYMVIN